MSKFYGMVRGNRGAATRGGSANSGFKATAQSWDGSVITNLYMNSDEQVVADIDITNGSGTYGSTLLTGTVNDMLELQKVLSTKGLTSVNKLIEVLGGLTE